MGATLVGAFYYSQDGHADCRGNVSGKLERARALLPTIATDDSDEATDDYDGDESTLSVGSVALDLPWPELLLTLTGNDVTLCPRCPKLSPAASEGTTFTSITGDQGPTRWRGDGSSRCPLARGWRRASAATVATARG